MALESPEDLMKQMVAWMVILLVAAIFSCVYVLYHSEREAKRLITAYRRPGVRTHTRVSDESRRCSCESACRLIIFYAVVIAICVFVNLKSFMALMELRNRIQVEEQRNAVVTTEETRSGDLEAGPGAGSHGAGDAEQRGARSALEAVSTARSDTRGPSRDTHGASTGRHLLDGDQ